MSRFILQKFISSFQREGNPPKQEEETPEEKARQKEKEEWRIEGEAQEKREKDARDKEAERKREEERERFNKLNQSAALINEKFKTNLDFKTFYDIIININNLTKDIIFKEDKDDEDLKEAISYVLIGNNGEVIKEDTSFKLLLKKTFTFLSKIEVKSITGIKDLDDTLKDSGLSTINLGILKRYDYITINDGNGEVSGIEYTINDNENKLKNDNTLAIIPILFGIIVAFYINNKGKSENEKIYNLNYYIQ
jgi:FtsZ-interacting cell division protein YlmF